MVWISARLSNIWGSKSPKNLKRGHFIQGVMSFQLKQKKLKIFNHTTTYAILVKFTTNMYLNKVFHLEKFWGVSHRASQGINKTLSKWTKKSYFWPNFNRSISDAPPCILSLVTISKKIDNILGSSSQKEPKSNLNWQFLLVRKHFKI